MTRTFRIEITEWLVDGSSRGWSLNAPGIEEDRIPALHDLIRVEAPDHKPLKAEVTGVVPSKDGERLVVFAEVKP